MRRALFCVLVLAPAAMATACAAEDLPKREKGDRLDFEPELMLNDFANVPAASGVRTADEAGVRAAEAEIERGKSTARRHERLVKAGLIARVEAERSALKVVRLNAELEQTRALAAQEKVAQLRARVEAGELAATELAVAEAALSAAKETAQEAGAAWKCAERAAAELHLERQRKLLAAGAGSRVMVQRAEAALRKLQEEKQAAAGDPR